MFWSYLTTSSEKLKVFFTVYWDYIRFRYLANKYVDVLITDKIGRSLGVLLTTILCTLGLLYKMPVECQIGKYYQNTTFSDSLYSSLSALKRTFSLLLRLII